MQAIRLCLLMIVCFLFLGCQHLDRMFEEPSDRESNVADEGLSIERLNEPVTTLDPEEPMTTPDEEPLPSGTFETTEPPAVSLDPLTQDAVAKDDSLQTSIPVAPPVVPSAGRFRRTNLDCNVREEASLASRPLNTVPAGRRLWTEDVSPGWQRVYRQSGIGFMAASCFRSQ